MFDVINRLWHEMVSCCNIMLKSNIVHINAMNSWCKKISYPVAIGAAIARNGCSVHSIQRNLGQLCLCSTSRYQTITRNGCLGLFRSTCGFSEPQIRQWCLCPTSRNKQLLVMDALLSVRPRLGILWPKYDNDASALYAALNNRL